MKLITFIALLFSIELSAQIYFFPPVDTLVAGGGCTSPEIICRNLSSPGFIDSISVEPGFNTWLFYRDSLEEHIHVDNCYFLIIDSLNQNEYELWFYSLYPPFDSLLIKFDSTVYSYDNFEIKLKIMVNDLEIDSFKQPFKAEYGLGVDSDKEFISEFSLYQNYPNPFNPITNIKFRIANLPDGKAGFGLVTLKVYDVLGNEVATLINEEKQPGEYEVEFDASVLASGIYFYTIKAGDFSSTKKLILLK